MYMFAFVFQQQCCKQFLGRKGKTSAEVEERERERERKREREREKEGERGEGERGGEVGVGEKEAMLLDVYS